MSYLEDSVERMKAHARDHDTDVAYYFGDIDQWRGNALAEKCRQEHSSNRLLLMLATRGGDPNAAYRLGRSLQRIYEIRESQGESQAAGELRIFLPNLCKSAGTILATSATTVVMSDSAELGPIDAQLRSPIEVGERTSGLAPVQALESLMQHSRAMFRSHFAALRFDEALAFSTRLAATTAEKLTVGLLGPMYSQIDPIRLAEIERSLELGVGYTERLAKAGGNLKSGVVNKLLGGYPSHGFVIDRREARELFERVERPNSGEHKLSEDDAGLIRYCLYNETTYYEFVPAPMAASTGESSHEGAQERTMTTDPRKTRRDPPKNQAF